MITAVRIIFWLAVGVGLGVLAISAFAQIPRAAEGYKRQFTAIARSEWGLNAPVATLAAQIAQESGFDCNAVSRVGARGCGQVMPATADWLGQINPLLKGGDLSSPQWSFRAQAYYMRWIHTRVAGVNDCERMAFALSGYNGGIGRVNQRKKLSPNPAVCLGVTCLINPGIHPANQHENESYSRRILKVLEPRYIVAGWGPGVCQ